MNSIFTSEGGNHVEIIIDNISGPINDKVKEYLKKQEIKSSKDLTRAQIKNNIFLIVRSLVVNPSFDSQTKTCLRTLKSQFKKTLAWDPAETKVKAFLKQIGTL